MKDKLYERQNFIYSISCQPEVLILFSGEWQAMDITIISIPK